MSVECHAAVNGMLAGYTVKLGLIIPGARFLIFQFAEEFGIRRVSVYRRDDSNTLFLSRLMKVGRSADLMLLAELSYFSFQMFL